MAIGVKLNGLREVLGMWIGGNESAKYWLGVLNEIKNRGVEDIMIVSVDGLTGFGDAIHAVFPKAEVQRCIVHQMDATRKWTGKAWDWGLTLDQLCIYFEDRIRPEDID